MLRETGLPVNLHAGVGIPTYTSPRPGMPAKVLIMLVGTEFPWFAHRPLWFFVYGAVFERHPALKVVFTEQHCDWIPGILARLDYSYTNFGTDDLWGYVPRKPSEYFAATAGWAPRSCRVRKPSSATRSASTA